MTHLPRCSVMHLMAKYVCEHQRQRKGRFSWGRFRQRKFWLTKSEHLQELLSFSLCAKEMLSCSFLPQDNTLVHNVVRVKLSPQKCRQILQLSFTQISAKNKRAWDKSCSKIRWSLVIRHCHSLATPFQGYSYPAHLSINAEERLAISAFHLLISLGIVILKNCL